MEAVKQINYLNKYIHKMHIQLYEGYEKKRHGHWSRMAHVLCVRLMGCVSAFNCALYGVKCWRPLAVASLCLLDEQSCTRLRARSHISTLIASFSVVPQSDNVIIKDYFKKITHKDCVHYKPISNRFTTTLQFIVQSIAIERECEI